MERQDKKALALRIALALLALVAAACMALGIYLLVKNRDQGAIGGAQFVMEAPREAR